MWKRNNNSGIGLPRLISLLLSSKGAHLFDLETHLVFARNRCSLEFHITIFSSSFLSYALSVAGLKQVHPSSDSNNV